MDPKQTAPQDNNPVGGQEGQNISPAGNVAGNVSAPPNPPSPVFSFSGTPSIGNSPLAGPSVTSPNEPGTLGADKLSTGANVSNTMDSLNSNEQPTHDGLAFAKHRFDKIDPKTGDILLTPDKGPKKNGFFANRFNRNQTTAPAPTSMVENRHKDVVIPEEFQNTQPPRKTPKGLIAIIIVSAIAVVVVALVLLINNMTTNNGGGKGGGNTVNNTPASVLISDQLTDNLIYDDSNIEKVFAITNSKQYSLLSLHGQESLMTRFSDAFSSLEKIADILNKNANSVPSELSLQMTNLAETIAERLKIYKSSFSLADQFYDAYAEFMMHGTTEKTEMLLQSNNQNVRSIAARMRDDFMVGDYIYSPDMLIDIFATVAPPINYETDGIIYNEVEEIASKLAAGSYIVVEDEND